MLRRQNGSEEGWRIFIERETGPQQSVLAQDVVIGLGGPAMSS